MNKPTPLSDDFPALSRRRFLETATASVAGAAMFTGPNLFAGSGEGRKRPAAGRCDGVEPGEGAYQRLSRCAER